MTQAHSLLMTLPPNLSSFFLPPAPSPQTQVHSITIRFSMAPVSAAAMPLSYSACTSSPPSFFQLGALLVNPSLWQPQTSLGVAGEQGKKDGFRSQGFRSQLIEG
jgi:hypothetical protein